MKIIHGLAHSLRYPSPVVALGVFDGMHLAHLRLLRSCVKKAAASNGTSMVLTFWPHPQKQESLYSLPHRLRLIEELGVNLAIVARFDKAFARVGAEEFVTKILVKKLGVACVCVGQNFRFGARARGTLALLTKLAARHNFSVEIFKMLKLGGRRVSSTFIRALVIGGKLAQARHLLGRPVSVLGTVVKGASLGRRLGYPTANIDPHHEVLPPSGIYAVRVALRKTLRTGICYIGTKPTFKASGKKVVEAHIFNFSGRLYGQDLEIQFIKKIRDDRAFSGIPSLVQQIKIDVAHARRILQK